MKFSFKKIATFITVSICLIMLAQPINEAPTQTADEVWPKTNSNQI